MLIFHYVDFALRSWVNLTNSYSSTFNFVDKCLICCKLIPYLRNFFRTISVYILLVMTLQRFIYLYFPLIRSKVNSSKCIKIIILNLSLFSGVLNIGNLFINTLVKHDSNGELYCSIKPDYLSIQFIIDFLFVSFSILVPTLFILVFSLILFCKIRSNIPAGNDYFKLCYCFERNITNNSTEISKRNSLNLRQDNSIVSVSNFKSQDKFLITKEKLTLEYKLEGHKNQSSKLNTKFKTKFNQSIRTTYMLVLLSKWFVILHLPYFICWILFHLHINQMKKLQEQSHVNYSYESEANSSFGYSSLLSDPNNTLLIKGFLNLFEILFLSNYSINFLVYLLNGPLFRKHHSKIFCKGFEKCVFLMFCSCFGFLR